MAVTYEWDVQSIDVIAEHGAQEHVVYRVVWKCTATDGERTKDMIGVQELPVSNIGPDFVPYEDVTKEQILEWVKVWLNVPAIEASILPNTYTRSFLPDATPQTNTTSSSVVPEMPGDFVAGDPGL